MNNKNNPRSMDLEEAANKVMPDGMFTFKSSITPEDDEDAWSYEQVIEMFKAGANWQKEQMMKDAIKEEVVDVFGAEVVIINKPENTEVGDKVKIIIIKEDQYINEYKLKEFKKDLAYHKRKVEELEKEIKAMED